VAISFSKQKEEAVYRGYSKKEKIMCTKTAVLVTTVFMLVTASASFVQAPISDDDAKKEYPVCSTWRAKDAGTGTCRTAFHDARNALGY